MFRWSNPNHAENIAAGRFPKCNDGVPANFSLFITIVACKTTGICKESRLCKNIVTGIYLDVCLDVKMATLAEKHGALEYVNSIADDVKPGKVTSFPQAVKLADDEVVVISWAVYKSREDRDRANKAIMEDEDFKQLSTNLPVDGKRMFMGGFKVLRGL